MDNLGELSAMVAPLLNDPQAMENLRKAAEQMGLGGLLSGATDVGGGAADAELPGNKAAPESEPARHEGADDASAQILSAVTKLAPLLTARKEDDTTRLLSALRPFLSQPRARRLDEAERLLSVSRILSIIKESKLM